MSSFTEPADPPRASSALARFTVLDLSRVRAGPTAARQLADWGANVITVEMPASVDAGDPHVGPRQGPDFQNLNRNKRSMTLNLKTPEAIAILKSMVKDADIVLENFRPDVKHRLGLDYDTLAAINPRLVYASISGFGQDGPYRERPGFDQIAQGMGGLMSLTGAPGQGPMRVGIPVADLCAGLMCAFGILVALLEREVSGRGQWLHTSLLQTQAFMLDFQAARWLMAGEVAAQDGNNHATIAPCGVFRTQDGYINLAIVGQLIWQRFCAALQQPGWFAHADFASNALRVSHRDRLHAAIENVLQNRAGADWIETLNAAGVPCGPIHDIRQLFEDPQVRHLAIVQRLATPAAGAVDYLGQPLVLSRTPSRVVRHTPALGEHTDDILGQMGYAAGDIASLRERGVI